MFNPDFELDRLTFALRSKGYSEDEIEQIVSQASKDINDAITDAVANAVEEAAQAGLEKNAEEFVQQLKIVQADRGNFYLSTDSGMMDFSEPPFPMMSALLKNPKVAKDGSLYKVVPVEGKSLNRDISASLMDVQKNISRMREQAKAAWSEADNKNISRGAMQFSGDFAAQKANLRDSFIKKRNSVKKAGKPNFRTVTSKQDPTKQWVQPAKDKDMTDTIDNINSKLKIDINNAIIDVINEYQESF